MSHHGSTGLFVSLLLIILRSHDVHNGFACLTNPCIHGVCLDELNSTYFCYCIDGYTGLQCQTNWNDCWSSPCLNGGICLDGVASFNCTCPPGYVGDLCEEDFNECESNPCWNNGTCMDGPNGYECQCISGYSGPHCEIDIAVCNSTGEARCKNSGICVEGRGDTFYCKCLPGWEGSLCEKEIDECRSSPCQNGAVCVDLQANYECACVFGYTGKNCEEIIKMCEKNPCSNGALCLVEDEMSICYCVPDFHGDLCQYQYDECQLGPRCSNGGTCIDGIDNFMCSCPPGLTGVFCECLILLDNQLDCNYIAPTSTIYMNLTTAITPFETDFTTYLISEKTSVETTEHLVVSSDLTTKQVRTETTTIPSCITPTTITTKSPDTTLRPDVTNSITVKDLTDITQSITSPQSLTSELVIQRGTELTTSGTAKTTTKEPSTSMIFTTFGLETPSSTDVGFTTSIPASVFTESFRTTFIGFTETSSEQVENFTKADAVSTTELIKTTKLEELSTTHGFTSDDSFRSTISIQTTEIGQLSTFNEDTTDQPNITSSPQSKTTTDQQVVTNSPPIHTTKQMSTDQPIVTTSPSMNTTKGISTDPPLVTVSPPINTTKDMSTEQPIITYSPSMSTSKDVSTEQPNTTVASQTSTIQGIVSTTAEPLPNTFMTFPTTGISNSGTSRSFPEYFTTPVYTTSSSERYTTVGELSTTSFSEEPGTSTEKATSTSTPTTIFLTELPGSLSTELTTSVWSTISPDLDCSLPGQSCANGGSCIFTGNGHKCLCPFDTDGIFCETVLGINNAAFSGNSFLSHRLIGKQNISIEFNAKILSTSGTIFYLDIDESYMAAYIHNGYLMFKFSCGFQTMLLSELNVAVNNGYPTNIKAKYINSAILNDFFNGSELNFSHCDAVFKINNTLTMSGDQMAKTEPLSNAPVWLHMGGHPSNEIPEGDIPSGGFIGCMNQLKIGGRKVLIYNDAEEGYDIGECSSMACLSNPCKNGASCTSQGNIWQCHCRNGFLGKSCEMSICDDNPCMYGGTCIPFTNSGYLCLCPYGKHGHFCENSLKITEPFFSSTIRGLSSFAAYSLPKGISRKMEITFKFTPTTLEQISLLLFMGQNGQHDFYSDHLAVSFVKGYIMLTWNLGSGPRRIFTSKPIEHKSKDYTVNLGYDSRSAWLAVETLGNITGKSPGKSVKLNTTPFLYLGGYYTQNFSTLPHDLPLHTGFSGCIFDLDIKAGSAILSLQATSTAIGRAVGQCGTTECFESSCQNNGACLHHGSTFMCICQDKWQGPLCSSNFNYCDSNFTTCSGNAKCVPLLTGYECDCSYGFVGKNCDKRENISDVSFTGVRSFILTQPTKISSSKLNIEMEIRILKDDGILLYFGNPEGSYVCLTLQSGLLELRLHSSHSRNENDLLIIRNSQLLLKGTWHYIQFGVFGRKVYLYVDHVINTEFMSGGFLFNLPTTSSIHLGGLQDMSQLPLRASSILPIPFTGCLRHLTVNEKKIQLTEDNILMSRNVIDCDGTPCGDESCLNGGTCWLDSFMIPHCGCQEPYYGERCEFTPKCNNKTCSNGYCKNSVCHCRVGFLGGFCETEIQVKTPKFVGQSYLIVHKLGDKKRTISMDVSKIFLNFTTASSDGLLVWTKREKNFLGLGLERGYLKIAYSTVAGQKHVVELLSNYPLSDGLWHFVELSLDPLKIKVDNQMIYFLENVNGETFTSTGEFYLGGIPTNVSISEATEGMFSKALEGCISKFGTNENLITDVKSLEGANIENCNIL